jgi:signal transduction histidine kinase
VARRQGELMWTEMALFTAFALLLCFVMWWVWKQRQIALRQAAMDEKLTILGRGVRDFAHDLLNSLHVMRVRIEQAREGQTELVDLLDGLDQTTRSAQVLVHAMRGDQESVSISTKSAEGAVRLAVALLGGSGVPIEVTVGGTLWFRGTDVDALRFFQNLLANAVREAGEIEGGTVHVTIADGLVRMTNPVRDPTLLDDTIYEEGVSHSGSAGLGLAVAREVAGRLGWRLRHEVVDQEVTFLVEELPEATGARTQGARP